MLKLTVVVCTHRPRLAFWRETVAGLFQQTLPHSDWELIIIGDQPTQSAVAEVDLSWHPHVRQFTLSAGIAAARLHAMREFISGPTNVMLFVDDDNVLASDYLETGLAIGEREPLLGCWGGQLVGRFSVPPPDWITPFLKYIAVFPLDCELRLKGAFKGTLDPVPPTAGMFLRRILAENHIRMTEADLKRIVLGGPGTTIRSEDMDIGLGVLDIGYEAARFPQLTVTHLIPEDRLTEDYIALLLQRIRAGTLVYSVLRGIGESPRSLPAIWIDQLRSLRLPPRHRRFMQAELRGELLARQVLSRLRANE